MKRILLFIGIPIFLLGDFAKVGTAGAKFLGLEIGARANAMGGSYIGVGNDASLVFWNPGELINVEGKSLFTNYIKLFAGVKHTSMAFVSNQGIKGVMGVFFSEISAGDMIETTVDFPDGTGRTFGYSAFTFGGSYGKALTDKFSVGVNLKILGEFYDSYSKTYGWGFDVGTLYYTGWKSFRFGMVIQNFGPDLKPGGTYLDYVNGEVQDTFEYSTYPLPMTFRLGGAMDVFKNENSYLTLAVCAVHPNDNLENLRIGTEYSFSNMLFLRAGYAMRIDEQGISLGFGIKGLNDKLSIDYAFSDYGALPDVHRISAGMSF